VPELAGGAAAQAPAAEPAEAGEIAGSPQEPVDAQPPSEA